MLVVILISTLCPHCLLSIFIEGFRPVLPRLLCCCQEPICILLGPISPIPSFLHLSLLIEIEITFSHGSLHPQSGCMSFFPFQIELPFFCSSHRLFEDRQKHLNLPDRSAFIHLLFLLALLLFCRSDCFLLLCSWILEDIEHILALLLIWE